MRRHPARRYRAGTLASVSLTLALLAAAPPAGAAIVYVGDDYRAGQWVHYTAGSGELNRVTVSLGPDGYTISDPGATITPGTGCTALNPHAATCTVTSGAPAPVGVHAWLDDLSDVYSTTAAARAVVEAGGGDDHISGGPGADELYGGNENDTLSGGDGNDELWGGTEINSLSGGPGDDILWAGPGGTDTLSGGGGADTARYENEAASWPPIGVTASIDGLPNDGSDTDGPAGARDNIGLDIEHLIGSPGPDTLTGSAADNHLDGLRGTDTLNGNDGNDRFTMYAAYESTVTINGGNDQDTIDLSQSYYAGPGPIALDGQPHGSLTIATDVENAIGSTAGETIIGNASDNILDGGPGTCKDTFSGRGGRDTVSYTHARWPVAVSLDGIDNDGANGWSQYCGYPDGTEGDHLDADIENVQGGPEADVLTGDDGANTLDGGSGDDTLQGRAGADELIGGPGVDLADYRERTAPVTARLDGHPQSGDDSDGPMGGRDRILESENLRGGASADTLTGNPADNTIDGGAGADTISGLGGRDTVDYSTRSRPLDVWLDGSAETGDETDGPPLARDRVEADVEDVLGGAGDDLIVGNVAQNVLSGGGGDDFLVGSAGADTLHGDAGDADVAAYLDRHLAVDAVLDGTPTSGNADDGPAGHRDTIATVEALFGGAGPDTLTGNGQDNLLNGGPGADRLSGLAGLDAADYSERTDALNLTLDGSPTSGNADDGPTGARDRVLPDIEALFAGRGHDTLTGNPHPNLLDGGDGNDTLDSRDDDADFDACGSGADTANVDEYDVVDGCESVSTGEPPITPTPTPSLRPPTAIMPTTGPPTLQLPGGQTLRTLRSRGLSARVTCPEACTIEARLRIDGRTAKRVRLGSRATTIGHAKTALRAAGTRTVTIKLTRRARSRLASLRTLSTTLQVTAGGTRIVRRLRLTRTRTLDHAAIAGAARAATPRPAALRAGLLGHDR